MRLSTLLFCAALALGCSAAPRSGFAQPSGGQPVRPSRNTQFVFQNERVVQRLGTQFTPLTHNVRLPNGTKINVRSGIVEFPSGKITPLHEGDYVNAEGGIVFATPASAAAARGNYLTVANAQYDKYVQVGVTPAPTVSTDGTASPDSAAVRELLLRQKVELLNRKLTLLQSTHPNAPNTSAVDKQLQALDARLQAASH